MKPVMPGAIRVKVAVYYVCRALGLFRLARRLTRRRLKILCYHGFEMHDEAQFRPKLFIRPAEFERRLATIARYGLRVLPLDQAVEALYAGTLGPDAVAITIDDGFYSTHDKALPLLERFGFPATVYVTSYYVEHPNPVFRLVVQYMFHATQQASVAVDGQRFDLADPAQRESAAWAFIRLGEQGTEHERVALCERLGGLLGTPYAAIAQSKALNLMTPAQLAALEAAGVAVELHTHRHVLPPDDRQAVQREIAENRAALRRWVQRDCLHFCYPSGMFDVRQWPWLDEMGVRSSTTCLPGLNSRRTPRHGLRRFLDGANIHQLEFEAALSGFSDIVRWFVRGRQRHQ